MELRQLRQFVAVAETLSFRQAAERLFMAQPPLSVAIRKLEEEIGVPLFERSARGVRLTPAGKTALDMARQCLAQADQFLVATRSAATGETGHLRIGFIGSVTFGLMPALIQSFSARYPLVKLDLRESTNQEILAQVETQELDLGFVRVPTSRPAHVQFQMVEKDVFCAALPPGHPLARKKKLVLKDLEDQPFIGYAPSRVGGLHAAVSLLLQQADIAPHITQEAVQVQTVIGLVESGLGVALVPSVNAPYSSRRVAFRPIRDLPAQSSIGIALAFHQAMETPVAKRFREAVAGFKGREHEPAPVTVSVDLATPTRA